MEQMNLTVLGLVLVVVLDVRLGSGRRRDVVLQRQSLHEDALTRRLKVLLQQLEVSASETKTSFTSASCDLESTSETKTSYTEINDNSFAPFYKWNQDFSLLTLPFKTQGSGNQTGTASCDLESRVLRCLNGT